MSKKLEALECFDKIYNTINLNWQRDLLRVGIDIYNHSDCNDGKEMTNCLDTIKQVLLELQSIKEAKPSEALECLERIEKYFNDRNMYEDLKLGSDMYYNAFCIIRQALINFNNLTKQINDASGKSAIGLLNKINKLDSYTYNNILEALLKTQNLEREKVECKRVLKIIFKKNVDVWQLKQCDFERYNFWVRAYYFDFRKELTEEEFDLVKRLANTINI